MSLKMIDGRATGLGVKYTFTSMQSLYGILALLDQVYRFVTDVAGPVLKSLRLQLIPQLTRWRQKREQPKVVYYRDRSMAVLIVLPHLLPLGVAISLILMNTALPRLFHNVGQGTVTTLQFWGKALELMMQASIAAILLDFIRRQAVIGEGLPFGSLVAHLRATDPSYLWSLELWGSLTGLRGRKCRLIATVAFIPLMVVLAALVGPSGTVLLIPRLMARDMGTALLLMDEETTLFPSTINYLNRTAFVSNVAQMQSTNWVRSDTRSISDSYSTRNMLSISENENNFYESDTIDYYSAVTSIPGQQIAKSFTFTTTDAAPDLYPSTLNTTSKQPFVLVYCNSDTYDRTAPGRNVSFDLPVISDSAQDPFGTFTVGQLSANTTTDVTIRFANESLVSKYNYSAILAYSQVKDASPQVDITVCTVKAMWVNSSLGQVYPDLLEFDFKDYPARPSPASAQPALLKLTDRWTQDFTVALQQQNTVVNLLGLGADMDDLGRLPGRLLATALADSVPTTAPPDPYDYDSIQYDSDTNTNAFAGFVTEDQFALLIQYVKQRSLDHKYHGIVLLAQPDWTNATAGLDALTHQEMVFYKSIHSYGCKPIAVRLSLAVISLYCFVTMSYLAMVIKTGGTGQSWDSMGEMLALALNSPMPQGMGSVSAGIETIETYRRMVRVGVKGDDEEEGLALIFAREGDVDPGVGWVKGKEVVAGRGY